MYCKQLAVLIITGLLLVSCDLDDLGVEIPEPPEEVEAPDFSKINMNTEAFSDAQGKAGAGIIAENVAVEYEVAASIVSTLNSQLNLVTNTLSDFMDPISTVEPDFSNGVLTWNYQANIGLLMNTVDVVLEAGIGFTTVTWSGSVSGNVLGEDVDDYPFLSGTTTQSGDSGNMSLSFESAVSELALGLAINWELNNDILTDLTFELSNSALDGPSSIEFTYTLDGTSAEISGETVSEGGSVSYIVTWDTETGAGSLTTPDLETVCWDSEKQSVEC